VVVKYLESGSGCLVERLFLCIVAPLVAPPPSERFSWPPNKGFSVLGSRVLQQEAKRAPNASITAAQSAPALQGPYAQQLTKDYSVPWAHEGLVWLAKEYGLTTPQLIFNWALARLGAIVVATANEQHMRQALNETAVHGNALKWPSLRYLNSLGARQANIPESEAKGTRQQHEHHWQR